MIRTGRMPAAPDGTDEDPGVDMPGVGIPGVGTALDTAVDTVETEARAAGRARWGVLPAPVEVEDMRQGQPASDPLDPSTVYDPEREWLIRYGAGGL